MAALVLMGTGSAQAARAPSCGPLKADQVSAAVAQVLDEARAQLPEGAEVEPGLVEARSCDRLPTRFADIDVRVRIGRRVGRKLRAAVRLLDKRGRRVGQAWLSIEVDVRVPTVVAARRLSPGDVVRADDVRVEMLPPDRSRRGACGRADQVVGLAAQRSIRAGEPLTEQVLDRPVLVRRGAIVRASVRSGPLRVMSQGIAQEEGRFGDRILLKTEDGNRDFMGRVTRTGDVVVVL